MQKASCILRLACQAVSLGILLCKFAHAILPLVGGATNYLCFSKPTPINS
jgi:hypothetical protein